MKPILSKANADVLAQVAWARTLLAFDFDGTLAPIVDDRERASMRATTLELLSRLCELYPCAIISGRSQLDVAARVAGTGVKHVVGNHGLEPGTGLAEFAEEISRTRALLADAMRAWPGIDLEDKRYSLALHYRRCRRKREARLAIHGAIARLPAPMRIVPGKMVVNVVPARAPDKGDALLRLRDLDEGADVALYVGDDVTDEDVFKLDQPGRLLTVRVGESRGSGAAYFLRTQRDIDALLSQLVLLRTERSDP